MSKLSARRNLVLLEELHRFFGKHPDMLDQIPYRAMLFITVKGDRRFNAETYHAAFRGKTSRQPLVEARKEGKRWVLKRVMSVAAKR